MNKLWHTLLSLRWDSLSTKSDPSRYQETYYIVTVILYQGLQEGWFRPFPSDTIRHKQAWMNPTRSSIESSLQSFFVCQNLFRICFWQLTIENTMSRGSGIPDLYFCSSLLTKLTSFVFYCICSYQSFVQVKWNITIYLHRRVSRAELAQSAVLSVTTHEATWFIQSDLVK